MGIAVTGTTGFVGRALCAELLKRNTLAIHLEVARAATENMAIGCVPMGTDGKAVFGNASVLVHLAARVHVMHDTELDPLAAFRMVNVDGALNLARQAAESGLKRFVFISSIGVNGAQTAAGKPFAETDPSKPHNAYAQSKWEAEKGLLQLAYETGLEVVIIRPPLVYGFNAPGNFATLMRAVQRGWPLPLGLVDNQRSLVALVNLVDFIITCITHPKAANQTFLVSDGHDLSTPELVRGLAQAGGMPARLLPVPVWTLQTAAFLLGKADVFQRLCGNLQVDISKARNLLGWVPPVSVEEGFRGAMAE